MSLVVNQVWRLDAYLDRLPILVEPPSSDGVGVGGGVGVGVLEAESRSLAVAEAFEAPRLDNLLRIVRSLSTTSSTQALLTPLRIKTLLHESGLLVSSLPSQDGTTDGAVIESKSPYENQVEWLLVSKATVQVYGVVLDTLLERIIPLSDDIWYWDDVVSSYGYSSLYTVQTSPLRLWAWSQDVYDASRRKLRSLSARNSHAEIVESTSAGLSRRWGRFYGIVQDAIRERSLANIQRKILSPVAYCQAEARHKQAQLRRLREITASGLGVLIDEGLQIDGQGGEKAQALDHQDVKAVVERSVSLMDTVLKEVCTLEASIQSFEEKVFAGVQGDSELSVNIEGISTIERPATLARRLLRIIDNALPEHMNAMTSLARNNGRPHAVIRYWLPALIGLTSSTTILRILVNRRTDIIDWITDFGRTMRDFWLNWVVQPIEKIIRTIRHDEASEIAIMSRDSLRADRESLERMVVDFAFDKPHFVAVGGTSLSDAQIAEIRSKVAEGDVTPVLRAYEQDLRSPFVGALRGDLVRSLLIQVQKTKVDLEVAMTGIDSLLKSQELVFGFVGLTPGVLVSIGIMQYLRGVFGGRSSQRHRNKAGQAVRILRNIDRILSEANPTENNVLSYKDHGLLLCEVHVLRNMASKLLPRNIEKEFLEDLDDLATVKGIQVQMRALERIRWAYARWLR